MYYYTVSRWDAKESTCGADHSLLNILPIYSPAGALPQPLVGKLFNSWRGI